MHTDAHRLRGKPQGAAQALRRQLARTARTARASDDRDSTRLAGLRP